MVVRVSESSSFEAYPSQAQIANLIKRNQQWLGLLRQKGNHYHIKLKIKPTSTKLIVDLREDVR